MSSQRREQERWGCVDVWSWAHNMTPSRYICIKEWSADGIWLHDRTSTYRCVAASAAVRTATEEGRTSSADVKMFFLSEMTLHHVRCADSGLLLGVRWRT